MVLEHGKVTGSDQCCIAGLILYTQRVREAGLTWMMLHHMTSTPRPDDFGAKRGLSQLTESNTLNQPL